MASGGMSKIAAANELYNKGIRALESGQYDYAITLLKEAVKLDPAFDRAHEALKLARVKKLRSTSPVAQKMKAAVSKSKGLMFLKMKKWEKALDALQDYFALVPEDVHMLPHLGEAYYHCGMTDKAIGALIAALEADRNNISALRLLGRIYIEQERYKEAKPLYDRLLLIAGNNAEIEKEVKDAYALMTIEKGWDEDTSFTRKTREAAEREEEIAQEEGEREYTPEIKMARHAVQEDPQNPEKRRKLVQLYIEGGYMREAIDEARELVNLEGDKVDNYHLLADAYLKAGLEDKAVSTLEEALPIAPEDIGLLRRLTELYLKRDALVKATEMLERLARLTPEDIWVHENLGDIYMRRRYFDKAAEQYEQVVKMQPEREDIHETLAGLYVRRRVPQKAIEHYEEVLRINPQNAGAAIELGRIYEGEGELQKAYESYKKALEAEPGNKIARSRLLGVEARLLDNQIAELEAHLQQNPEDSQSRAKIEELRRRKNEISIESLQEMLAQDPENPQLHYELGMRYFEIKEWDKAIGEFQKSQNHPKRRVESLNMLGLCFKNKGMLDLALNQFLKAAEEAGPMSDIKKEILYNLGLTYEEMGKLDEALEQYKKIYEVDITFRDVASKIEQAYRGQQG